MSVFDATTPKLAEIPVGTRPRSVAIAADGRVWVTNKDVATVSLIDPLTLLASGKISLPRASLPHGLAMSPDGKNAFVALEATGQILKYNTATLARTGMAAVGANPRHLAVRSDGSNVLVSRFITPLQPGESTARVHVLDRRRQDRRRGAVGQRDDDERHAHRRAGAQRAGRHRAFRSGGSQLSGRRGRVARRLSGLGSVEAGQRQERPAARRPGAELPEHGARHRVADRPGLGQRRPPRRGSTSTMPAWPVRPCSICAACTCSWRWSRVARSPWSMRTAASSCSASMPVARPRASPSPRTA